jgi:ribosomal RNA assembly protein
MLKKILVPRERLPVIIGIHGRTKSEIEKQTRTKITVSEDVEVMGDVMDVITAENIITAIARGFAPERALRLIEEDNILAVIDLPRDERTLIRIRSRLIGTNGKTRRNIEEYTKTGISIYGKTAAVIGSYENAETAREAIEKLIKGFTHKTVYKFLEEKRKEQKPA